MTLDELKAMHAAMTPGEWIVKRLPGGQVFVEGMPLPPHLAFGTDILGDDDYDTKEDDARGIVAMHNAFPALVERYERMRAALAYYANKSNYASKLTPGGGSWYMEIELDDGDRAIEAIADADKPLESRS